MQDRRAPRIALGLALATGACGRLGYDPLTTVLDAAAGDDQGDAGDTLVWTRKIPDPLDRAVLCRTDVLMVTGPTRLTVFRVHNRGAPTLAVPLGPFNDINPAPADRGQPQRFPAGDTLFAVVHRDAQLVWRLASGTATSRETVGACSLVSDGTGMLAVLDDGRRVPVAGGP